MPKRKKTAPPGKSRQPTRPGQGLPAGYAELLDDLKRRIRESQVKAALAVNRELTQLYWDIGQRIVERQRHEGWGKAVVERLAADVQKEFPGIAGFSPQNIWKMRAFYLAYTEGVANLSQPVREFDGRTLPAPMAALPWGHNTELLFKVKDPAKRLWYARAALEYGWSRPVLMYQIESNLYGRQGRAVTNFERALPPPRSDLARDALKDPYNFDFLTLAREAQERDLEEGLLAHIRKFLLELGAGFAFVGQQVHLEVGGDDFYVDLLFYHLKLRCYIVIDLKAEEFEPEHAGKMNFYLSAVDDLLRHPDDKPSIGIILCKAKNQVVAEYALRDVNKPVGVSSYVTRLVESLPASLRGQLPDPERLQEALRDIDSDG